MQFVPILISAFGGTILGFLLTILKEKYDRKGRVEKERFEKFYIPIITQIRIWKRKGILTQKGFSSEDLYNFDEFILVFENRLSYAEENIYTAYIKVYQMYQIITGLGIGSDQLNEAALKLIDETIENYKKLNRKLKLSDQDFNY